MTFALTEERRVKLGRLTEWQKSELLLQTTFELAFWGVNSKAKIFLSLISKVSSQFSLNAAIDVCLVMWECA